MISRVFVLTLASCTMMTCLRAGAGEIKPGPDLSAAQLAKHLGVQCWSFECALSDPTRKTSVVLFFKHRPSPNEPFVTDHLEAVSMSGFPLTTMQISVLVDSSHSTLVIPSGSGTGKGVDFGSTFQTFTMPERNKEGTYILLKTQFERSKSDQEDVLKGTLELKITQE